MKNKFFRTFAVTLAAVLCFTAFSTTAFAGGADPAPAPLPEETGTPTTGGIPVKKMLFYHAMPYGYQKPSAIL